jgi:HK97 gp10 family phage protein
MATVSVTIKGLKELDAALRALPDEMQAAPVRAGLKAGAKVLADGMSMRAPRDQDREGVTLAEEIVTATRVSNTKGTAVAQIGPSKAAFYGFFQEFGTAHHVAQPFMRPTIDLDGQIAVAAYAVHMKAGIERAVKRLARRAA